MSTNDKARSPSAADADADGTNDASRTGGVPDAIDRQAWRREIDARVEAAAGRTDRALAGELARVTRLSEDEIAELFPEAADAERLGELMSVVRSSAARHERVNALVRDAERFGDVTLSLLERLA